MADSDPDHLLPADVRRVLNRGVVIPAHPLALTARRALNERRQRTLSRYYIACGVGGLAVGVHTTQFQIRDPQIGLFRPVLQLAREEMDLADTRRNLPLVRIAGVCGRTSQAMNEAELVRDMGYHIALLSLSDMNDADDDRLIEHCRQIGQVLALMGFYLQPAVGGRLLSYKFWRRFFELPCVVAVKIAPFNRYQTLDVIRAVVDAGRDDVALYTGNDDNIVMDLLTPYRLKRGTQVVERRIVGGLLGHWSVWTRRAVELLDECHRVVTEGGEVPPDLLARSVEITDANAAFFDAANGFAGCIAGLHEVLRRQGLLEGIWCLNPQETLGKGQIQEIDRVYRAYPHLHDDAFVEAHKDQW